MLRLIDIEEKRRIRLARALYGLQATNSDYQEFLSWISDNLKEMRTQTDVIRNETELRMQQGQCQALQGILNIHNEAVELIRSK